MIVVCTSMYWEAYPFIQQYNLKKDMNTHKFQLFESDDVILVITGVGKIKAAIAVTFLLSKYGLKESDILINIGVCGSNNQKIPIGTLYFCNQIFENDTKKSFYPDMLFKHPFQETSVETCSRVIEQDDIELRGTLVDMEASGIYQAGSVFLQPHQMIFVKIVSDHLKSTVVSKEALIKLIETKSKPLIDWMNHLKQQFSYDKQILSKEEADLCASVIANLHLSATMENQLKQLLIYYKLQNGQVIHLINKYTEVSCDSKKEGKGYFARLKQQLI